MADTLYAWEVEYMDTEHRIFSIEVDACSEMEAEDSAMDEAAQSYHGPSKILSVDCLGVSDNNNKE